MASKIETRTSGQSRPDIPVEQGLPSSSSSRPPVTNVMLVGQQLAQAFGPAQALINQIPRDPDAAIEELRRWYCHQHPAERDRLLWQRFTGAEQIYGRLEDAIRGAREALEVERLALVQAEGERSAFAAHPLPHTVGAAATNARIETLRRYQSLGIERDARRAAIADLERLLLAPGQTLNELTEATARILEAVVTIDREAFVGRLRESGELEHLRARFERLRMLANTHDVEIAEWSQRVGRPLRIPRVTFPWPPPAVWDAFFDTVPDVPELRWDDDLRASST